MYEAGKSFSQIADELPVSDRSMKEWCRREGWIKGKASQELHQKEQAKLEKEAEAAGIDRARILKELALVGFADMADYVDVHDETGTTRVRGWGEMNQKTPGSSRVVKKIREKRTIRQSNDKSGDILVDQTFEFELHDKIGSLVEMGNILGLKKVQIDPSDGFREFFQGLRGN
jgi:hypothetical protein